MVIFFFFPPYITVKGSHHGQKGYISQNINFSPLVSLRGQPSFTICDKISWRESAQTPVIFASHGVQCLCPSPRLAAMSRPKEASPSSGSSPRRCRLVFSLSNLSSSALVHSREYVFPSPSECASCPTESGNKFLSLSGASLSRCASE